MTFMGPKVGFVTRSDNRREILTSSFTAFPSILHHITAGAVDGAHLREFGSFYPKIKSSDPKQKAEWESTVGSPFLSRLALCWVRDIAFGNCSFMPIWLW